jgi:predicted nucleic acid-binding protein
MSKQKSVFLDANIFVYYLDRTSNYHAQTMETLQRLIVQKYNLYTSHHVLEEVLHVMSKLVDKADLTKALAEINTIPGLNLVEPETSLEFEKRYLSLYQRSNVGINDCLLLQLMLDSKIDSLSSFDQKFTKLADECSINTYC